MKPVIPGKTDRRSVLAGAGAVGALAGVAATLPLIQRVPGSEEATGRARADGKAGYQLTEHVERYYATARI